RGQPVRHRLAPSFGRGNLWFPFGADRHLAAYGRNARYGYKPEPTASSVISSKIYRHRSNFRRSFQPTTRDVAPVTGSTDRRSIVLSLNRRGSSRRLRVKAPGRAGGRDLTGSVREGDRFKALSGFDRYGRFPADPIRNSTTRNNRGKAALPKSALAVVRR